MIFFMISFSFYSFLGDSAPIAASIFAKSWWIVNKFLIVKFHPLLLTLFHQNRYTEINPAL